MNDWKSRLGVVYSTSPDYEYQTDDEQAAVESIPPSKQRLVVALDKRNRRGKQVTLIAGYKGSEDQLAELGRTLRNKCGVGGSAKDSEIILQGDHRQRVVEILEAMGYKARML